MYTRAELIALAQAYLAATGMTPAALSRAVMGRHNSKLFERLFAGADCLLRSAEIAAQWFDHNWPPGVAWPLRRRIRFRNVTALRRSG